MLKLFVTIAISFSLAGFLLFVMMVYSSMISVEDTIMYLFAGCICFFVAIYALLKVDQKTNEYHND